MAAGWTSRARWGRAPGSPSGSRRRPLEGSAADPPAAHLSAARPGLAVLLVDDDPDVGTSLQGLLDLLGHRVDIALSGEEALARLEAGDQLNVVFLDVNMPGLGGHGTLPRLRRLRPDTPVVLVTGKADQAALDLARTFAGVSLLPKPFTLEELRGHLAGLAPA